MTKDEALRLALEAMESCWEIGMPNAWQKKEDAITAIKDCLDKKWSDYPCYKWPGYITGMGYGQLGTKKKLGKNISAHRLVWEATNGPIPHGLSLDHLCRNPACVNPHHLEPVTHKENCLRGVGITAINSKKNTLQNRSSI